MRAACLRSALALTLASACQSPARDGAALAAIDPEIDTVFEYIAAKYDANGDGAVAPEEYRRQGIAFADLDKDGDGALTQADFPDEALAREKSIADLAPEQRERMGACYSARAVVLTYLPPDPAEEGLSRAALDAGLARLDLDGDGALARSELERITAERPWGGPGDAWELLVAAVDRYGDGNGVLSRDELGAYHELMSGKDGLVRGPTGWAPPERGMASDGPPVGAPAPDFALAPPDGGDRVRLSDWAGKKPVALIFGSYT